MSVTAEASSRLAAPPAGRADGFIVAVALAFMAVLGGLIWLEAPADRTWLFLIGAGLGISLYHAAFGFTAGWRRYAVERRSAGLRAQLLLLGIASVLFIPVLGGLVDAGSRVSGALAPVGTSLLAGAFLFGLGMQLGNGCGSGTLFTAGAGNRRMSITLVFFIAGSVIGTLHLPWWLDRPGLDPVSLIERLGMAGALAAQLALLALLAGWFMRKERTRHGDVERLLQWRPAGGVSATLLTGGWPLLWGAVALAGLSLATLLVAGHPWGITFAFALWGAKILGAAGVDVAQWEFWTWDYPALALADSVLVNVVSVMDFGLLLGAMLAAGLAGRFNRASARPLALRSAAAAAAGGLLMGYGARLGFGCNIGAMFGGIASASLHGWIWFAAAFAGSLAGIRLRPLFGMSNG